MKRDKIKITHEVNKRIKELAESLPKVPVIMPTGDGKFTEKEIKTTKVLSPKDVPNAVEGKRYVQRSTEVHYRNHAVHLRQMYQSQGEKGMQIYIDYVNDLDKQLKELATKPTDNVQGQGSIPNT